MWDESKVSITEVLKRGYSLSIKCSTLYRKTCWVTNVYGPIDYKDRKFIQPELSSLGILLRSLVYWRGL